MLDELSSLPQVLAGFLGSLAAGLGTALGALPIFFRAHWSETARALMLALAAGVMLGATVFSLLIPALDVVTARTGSETQAALVASGGIALGAIVMSLIHARVPHEHFIKGPENENRVRLGRKWLFVLAITLHNFPEGMSVGVAYGADFESGVAVTIGIGLQNLPEGLAVAAALIGDRFSRSRAFWIAALTGMVEPAGGLLGAFAVGLSDALLPWGLTFAAGAMLFVISGEIIPETHRSGVEQRATFSLVIGFILMMMLDVSLG
jgi:zinc transporter, ZIP family